MVADDGLGEEHRQLISSPGIFFLDGTPLTFRKTAVIVESDLINTPHTQSMCIVDFSGKCYIPVIGPLFKFFKGQGTRSKLGVRSKFLPEPFRP